MFIPNDLQEYSICSMYRDGVSLHRLEIAFDREPEELLEILRRHGVARGGAGENRSTPGARERGNAEHRAA